MREFYKFWVAVDYDGDGTDAVTKFTQIQYATNPTDFPTQNPTSAIPTTDPVALFSFVD